MIVKFFSGRGRSSSSRSCKACIDYLLNKPNNHAKTLQGNPRLTQAIADGLEFKNTYTAGCLSFEEKDIPEHQKLEIMTRFENSLLAGLDHDQYNISWVQHTDKGRLELNFVIANVNLETGKRLQPYYDKAHRPLVENFKQVINHEYNLSDPNSPDKKQTLISNNRLPSNKKEALQLINDGITAQIKQGRIKNREDVINFLEEAGFEIARITPKNISIKTTGQNLRLKGAFYEQSFKFSEDLSEDIRRRTSEYQRDSEERYQTARERLNQAVARREQENRRSHPRRAEEVNQENANNLPLTHNDSVYNSIDSITFSNSNELVRKTTVQRRNRMEEVSGVLSNEITQHQGVDLPNGQRKIQNMRQDRSRLYESDVGRQLQDNSEEINEHSHRGAFTQYIKELIESARKRARNFIEQIGRFREGKRLDPTAIQRNQRTINDFKNLNYDIKKIVENKLEQRMQQEMTRARSRGFHL